MAKCCGANNFLSRSVLLGEGETPLPTSGQFEVDGALFSAMQVKNNNGDAISINWGDLSTTNDTGDGTLKTYLHTYVSPGNYFITITCSSVTEINMSAIINQTIAIYSMQATLERFFCNRQLLQNLPALPTTLIELSCTSNQISSIPVLPAPLIAINLSDNQLTSLPTMSANLISMDFTSNQLNSLVCQGCLTQLVSNGLPNGTVFLDTQTPPAPPTIPALAAIATLGLNGWTVSTD